MPSLIRAQPFTSPVMLAVFGDEARLDAALRFESSLSQAQADVGVIDPPAAAQITATCLDHPDAETLAESAARRPAPPSQRPLR
ncbi:hypothetical protein [Caulobacter sp. UNC279MFTsu5.1]|uniref:hypothetical protein n=1 Tax=Caulobacter sp. UNC279MFTsu5.1 TaxID=1502775 RepID=UPI000B7F9EA1|nr:hypothetical protein [Caulobacter sp. UNC279MFTsu5.1]